MNLLRLSCVTAAVASLATLAACSSEFVGTERTAQSSQAVINHPRIYFGVRCQQDFQNNWAATLNGVYDTCSNFGNVIKASDTWSFYYNLHGAKPDLETTSDTCFNCGGADSVDFNFYDSHGGNWGSRAVLAMWDSNATADSTSMRLGDNGYGSSVFAHYACDEFQTSDNGFWNRWHPAFAGGVRIGLGAHGLVYDGNAQKGTEFGNRIEGGEPIGQSWNEAVWYADNNNTPSVANTGANSSDCWNRQGATLATVTSMGRLRDGQIGYMCWSGWNGM